VTRWKRLLRVRWLLAAAAVVAAAGAWWYRAHATRLALTVSRPRTIAVRRGPAPVRPYTIISCQWLDDSTLIASARFECWYKEAWKRNAYPVYGIVRVDTRTGAATVVRAPRPVGSPAAATLPGDPPCAREGDLSYDSVLPSPTGDRIAYRAYVRTPAASGVPNTPEAGVWISRADGSGAERIADESASPFGWSPGGRLLVFGRYSDPLAMRPMQPFLYVCRADGGGVRKLAMTYVPREVSFSPDSRQLAYADYYQRKAYMMDLRPGGRPSLVATGARCVIWVNGSLVMIKTEKARLNWFARWPWLRKLLHVSPPNKAEVDSLVAVDPVTRQATALARFEPEIASRSLSAPARSGSVFLLVHRRAVATIAGGTGWTQFGFRTSGEVCALTTDGLLRVPLEPDVGSPSWSPDGKRIVYIKDGRIKVVEVHLKTGERR
jgi:hypothetical protein